MTDDNANLSNESTLEAALELEADVEALMADVEGDDAAADAVEAIAEAEDIEPGGVLVETPSSELDEALDELAESEAIVEEAEAAADAADEADAADAEAVDGEVIDVEELLDAESAPPAPKSISPYDLPGKWYVLHTQSGYENKVRQNIEARKASMNMESRIHDVVIPMEDVTEFKAGKKVTVQKKVFPGYLLIRCSLNDDSWYVIRNTPGVTGFVGAANKPQPLPRKDVENFLGTGEEVDTEAAVTTKRTAGPIHGYEINETVRVKEGPFADFSGEIVEINEDQLKVKVLVNIFGRETPVELEFAQVAKL